MHDKARRFRDAALPHLDDVYTLARYLLRNSADAEDAVQECYLRALRHFDTYRGPAMKPWLFAILRNVCRAEFARRSGVALTMDGGAEEDEEAVPALAGGAGSRRKRKCCVSGMRKRSAGSSRSSLTRSAKRSCCARSTICPIARLPTSSVCPSAP